MTLKKFPQTLFVAALIIFGVWIIYCTFFPSRHYKQGQEVIKINIIAKETPYFQFTGIDEPHYYVITSLTHSNQFHISNEVLDLVQDNDSILNAIKEIKYGDTLLIYLGSTSISKLNKSSTNIEIIGLDSKAKVLIDPNKIEKYYRQYKLNNQFSILAIAIIFYFIYRKKIQSKKAMQ